MKKAYNTNYFFHKQERIKRSGILNNKRYLHLQLILFIYIKLSSKNFVILFDLPLIKKN